MKKINRHNYEVFFIDYFDNKLTKQDTQALFEFMELHADLKKEFQHFENFNLPNIEIKLDNKPELKKHLDESNIEHYIIAELEGELDHDDQQEYTDFIAENALYVSTVERYKRTILPKEDIVFPNKNKLKQKNRVIVFWPYAMAIAAALLLFLFLNTNNKTQQYQFQALQDIQEVHIDSLKTQSTPNKELQTTPLKTKKSIANNNYKNKKVAPTKTIDSIKNLPKLERQPLPIEKEMTPYIKKQEIEKINENIALVSNMQNFEENIPQVKETIPTLKQAIHNTIKTKLFNDENNKNQLIDKEYLITTAANKTEKISFEQTENKDRKKMHLKIGKFEFYSDKKV